jgi:hypothetical protein
MRTLSTTILSLLVLPLMAQVTIDQSNFPRQADFTDSYNWVQTAGLAIPTEGTGQNWDYSGLVTTSSSAEIWFDASGDQDFPTALHYSNADLAFQSFGIRGREYDAVDEDGWYVQGRLIYDTTHSITPISGGADDVLNFPDQTQVYEGRADIIAFPSSYSTSWESSYVEYTQFNLTVAGFGLNNVPGLQKRIISQKRTVVGEGTLIQPDAQGNPSGPIDALLIKVEDRVLVDSFFLGGQLAPPTLLSAFGLTQGEVTELNDRYLFFVPGYGNVTVVVNLDAIGGIGSLAYRPDVAGLATSIADASASDAIRAFPNPVEAGATLHFGLHGDGNTLAELTDVTGRTLLSTSVAGNGTGGRLDIPSSITPGIYTLVTRHLSTGNVRTQKVSIR